MTVRESPAVGYHWHPLERLSPTELRAGIEAVDTLDPVADVWRELKHGLDQQALDEFGRRLSRHVAIETGVLEGLYTLSRGVTETLIKHGIAVDIVDSSDEPVPPSTIDLIRDQLEASEFAMDVVTGRREMSSSFIKELHQLLTRHQQTTHGVDSLGRSVDIPLRRGVFKLLPNNPVTVDGTLHEYAPPEQVESEVDRLIEYAAEYESDGTHPVIRAAFVHHRFTQVHPFQDGNGRVARLLASIVCIKAGLFPLRIVREDRERYLDALRAADRASNFGPLVEMFALAERSTILEALRPDPSFGVPMERPSTGLAEQVVHRIAQRMGEQQTRELNERRRVNVLAVAVRDRVRLILETLGRNTEQQFRAQNVTARTGVDVGGPENGRDYWWRFQVIRTAKNKHFANLSEDHYWTRLVVEVLRTELNFVMSIHHVGRPLTGVMAVTFFAELSPPRSENAQELQPSERQSPDLGVEPVTFSQADTLETVVNRLLPSLDQAVALAMRDLGNAVV